MSTGIGNGVAIPHGKARAVDRMLAACAVSHAGVDFESADGERAHIFILLVSPETVGATHVKVLANISRLLKEESVRRSPAGRPNPDRASGGTQSRRVPVPHDGLEIIKVF